MKQQLPDKETQFSDWYNEVVYQAELADLAPVRGCMVIRPYGYALWEQIQKVLDHKIKQTGHQNAAFPLLIPESFLKKEAKHVEGFSPELAVVTHAGGKELEEPLVVRPTSETIIHYMFARWLRSWRDLPLKINQWASVVRWEMRTRPFLRTTEFWWQEGHTAHETAEEAQEEVLLMLEQYRDLAERFLAIPVVTGKKSELEKFAGADITMTFEGLMPDGKALQMGTSHRISQSFAHAFEMKFQDREGKLAYPHLTSWGATTRLIGALIMVHGDNKGLVLPPAVAPYQLVIIPIIKSGDTAVVAKAHELAERLGKTFRVYCDDADHQTPGAKFYHWELRGVPFRIEIGPRDLAQGVVVMVNRLTGDKTTVAIDNLEEVCQQALDTFQNTLFAQAAEYRAKKWFMAETYEEIAQRIEESLGFYQTGFCGNNVCEQKLTNIKASIRCILPDPPTLDSGVARSTSKICFACKEPSTATILIARSY